MARFPMPLVALRSISRSTFIRIFCSAIICTFLLYRFSPNLGFGQTVTASEKEFSACPPKAYGTGRWEYNPRSSKTNMTDRSQAYPFAGFDGCASTREVFWHLGIDNDDHFKRFPKASSWKWQPEAHGCSIKDFGKEEFVRDLVENGGWMILGDSISEGHFFSLSCLLYPHVVAAPDYTKNSNWDRGWPQYLYLNPASPLVPAISFPPGFNIESTPLVSFRRIDTLFEKPELEHLYREIYHPQSGFELFSDEQTWNLNPTEYLDLFTAPLPTANYANLIVSTGGHWHTELFWGLRDEPMPVKGIANVLKFFRYAMTLWAKLVQERLLSDQEESGGYVKANGQRGKRKALVRAYLPGHDDCHNYLDPWTRVRPIMNKDYNWAYMGQFNGIFEDAVSSSPDIHYLGIDQPARLRPDAHVTGDCLHIFTGSGVMEGWSHYIMQWRTSERQ
ncbi:hypothetical protein C8J56DRAFT_1158100 [Mycena floridula]|nr:hypothetical protein C8J56DRAFT_1158100 [Mycena floridula]